MGFQAFAAAPSWQTFVVPSGVTVVSLDITGGRGGPAKIVAGSGYATGGVPGAGARVQTSFPATPGEVFYLATGYSGGNGNGVSGPNWSGGGAGVTRNASSTAWVEGGIGGGATWVRRGSSTGPVVAVAGGGGGAGAPGYPTTNTVGGNGGNGGQIGVAGTRGAASGGLGGNAANQSNPGAAVSGGGGAGQRYTYDPPGIGGAGGSLYTQFWGAGGGGGGGYNGGGGGGRDSGSGGGGGGGGGGSSVVAGTNLTVTYTPGYNNGDGAAIFSWEDTPPSQSHQMML